MKRSLAERTKEWEAEHHVRVPTTAQVNRRIATVSGKALASEHFRVRMGTDVPPQPPKRDMWGEMRDTWPNGYWSSGHVKVKGARPHYICNCGRSWPCYIPELVVGIEQEARESATI